MNAIIISKSCQRIDDEVTALVKTNIDAIYFVYNLLTSLNHLGLTILIKLTPTKKL